MRIEAREHADRHLIVATAIFAAVFAMIVLAPFLVAPGTLEDLSGSSLVMDNQDELAGMNPLSWLAYTLGDIECHQISERSFFLNGNQMPFCSRDTAISAGLLVGALMAALFSIPMRWRWFLIAMAPMAVDVAVQQLTDYESGNVIRVATGMLAGVAMALILARYIEMPGEIRPSTDLQEPKSL